MMNFTSFSQTDTDSTSIQLEVPIVKLVIKDLITGDAAKEQLVVTDTIIQNKDLQLKTKDDMILNLNNQITNFNKIISTKDQQKQIQENLQKDLEKALKKAKRREFLYKVGTIAGGVMTVLYLTSK
tara:strand:- start:100 stop:477 length:378 start_codon:yes stop_codon:yes gene_type:complete